MVSVIKESQEGSSMNLGEKILTKILRSEVTAGNDLVSDVTLGEKGRVSFSVGIAFLSGGDSRLESEISALSDFSSLGTFYVDMIGDLIVRKHLSAFIEMLSKLTEDDYNQKLMLFNHLHFSIQKNSTSVKITLHVSHLHDVVLEQFLSQVEESSDNGNGN